MSINGVSMCSPSVNFRANTPKEQYENPINRSTERNLAILSSAAVSAFAGAVAGSATMFIKEGKKW